jgi:hypothetical protein
VSWTGTFTPGTTSLTCGSCHGNPPGGTHPTGADNCSTCHATYSNKSAQPQTADKSIHMNGVVDVDCVGCHGAQMGARRPVTPEFGLTWSHKRSAGGAVTKWDCIVCHMEGDPGTGERSAVHANGVINLRDPDTGNNIEAVTFTGAIGNPGAIGSYASTPGSTQTFANFSRNLGVALENDVAADRAAVQAIMINQCLKCHDADGALAFGAGKPLAQMATAGGVTRSAGIPFGTPIPGAGYNGGATDAGSNNTACAAGTNGCVANVNDSFATTNSSYHPIRGRNNNWFARAQRMVAPWTLAKINATTANANEYGYLMSCWDCHALPSDTGTITQTVTAHGGSATVRGVAFVSGTASASNAVTLCIKCHALYDTCSPAGGTATTCTTYRGHNTGSAFASDTGRSEKSPYLAYGCNLCHSSGYRTATLPVRPVRGKDAHGVNQLPAYTTGAVTLSGRWVSTTAANKRPYAFIRNIDTLGDHEPASAAGATMTTARSCDMLGTGAGGPGCNQGSEVYTVGGVY